MTDASGQATGQPAELDPLGANAGLFKPFTWPPPPSTGKFVPFRGFEDMDLEGGSCTLDRMPIPCGMVTGGNSVACPNNECSRYNPNLRNGRGGMEDFHAYADGFNGYFPSDGRYLGNGLVFSPLAGRGSEDELASIVSLRRNHASALPQNTRPLMTQEDIARLRSLLVDNLKGKCKDLVEAALKKIPGGVYNTDLLKVFNKIAEQGRLYHDETLTAVASGGGSVEDRTAAIVVKSPATIGFLDMIEELTHADAPSGGTPAPPQIPFIRHEVMAQAAIDAARALNINLEGRNGLPSTGSYNSELGDKRTLKGDYRNSVLFRDVLKVGGCR